MYKYTKKSLRESHRGTRSVIGYKIREFRILSLRHLSFKHLTSALHPRDDVASSLG